MDDQLTYLNKIMKWARRVVLAICLIYLTLIVLGWLIYIIVDPNNSSIELLKTVFELGLWLAIPVCVILLILRSWRLAIASIVPILIFIIIYVPQLTPRSPEFIPDAPQLTVMTFNLKITSEGIVDAIRSADADIVAVQELSQEGAEVLSELADIYPYQSLHPQLIDFKGQGILSRYPILDDVYWEYPDVSHTLGHQRVEVEFNDSRIVIYNVHPWPPLAWESGYNDESHRIVVEDIARRTFAEELPLILVGDFNMTDNFEEYELLASNFVDSYREAGNGIGYTFPAIRYAPLPSLLRLDYVWHSHHFQSVDAVVWHDHAESDHSPVVATIAFIQP